MKARGYGRIVNVASIAGKEGNPNASAYSASKAAVIGLTKSLGKELAKDGVTVNAVTPATIETPILEQVTPISPICARRSRWSASPRSTRPPRSSAGSRAASARSAPGRCSTFGRPGDLLTRAPACDGRSSRVPAVALASSARRRRPDHAADRRRLVGHQPCRGRRAALLRQARPPRLKVAALWEAPVERNAAEAACFRAVSRWLPRAVPGARRRPGAGLFAMDYLPPERFRCGRRNFSPDGSTGIRRRGRPRSRARSIEERRRSGRRGGVRARRDVRGDPHRALPARDRRAHPALAARSTRSPETLTPSARWFTATSARRTSSSARDGPVFLDAECAWFGDPAFDLAFCLNHLLLKGARAAPPGRYLAAFFGAGRRLSRPASIGRARTSSRRARPRCCRLCSSPGSTASRRSNI